MAREMKDSGIEWIGEIPREWDTRKLKYCSEFIQDKYSDKNGELEYIGLENISSWSGKYISTDSQYDITQSLLFQDEDILWGKLRPYLAKVYHAKKSGCCSSEFCVIRVSKDYSIRYFWNLLISSEFVYAIDRSTYGTKMPRANAEFIRNTFIPVPDKHKQQSIADFLDTQCAHIDSVIEKTRAAIVEYKKLKQAVITQAVTKGIRPNREMKNSGIEWIGEIPSAFVCRKLKSLTSLISKGATPKDISIELDDRHIVRFLKSENIVDNQLKEKPEFRITTGIHEGELKRSVLSENDILFVIAGASIGKTAIMEIRLLPANTNQAVSFIRIEPKYCFAKKFIWYFLQSEAVKRFIFLFAVQSAQPNLSMENLGSIRMPFPKSKEEVLEIITYLDEKTAAIDSLIQKKEQLITELEAYKKSLIYEYVTGKKEVPVHAH